MIRVSITTQDHRGKFTGSRTKAFTISAPEIEEYLHMLHDQGWTEQHSATVEVGDPEDADSQKG